MIDTDHHRGRSTMFPSDRCSRALVLLILAGTIGCASPGNPKNSHKPIDVSELQVAFPIGTEISLVTGHLERGGFVCRLERNSEFKYRIVGEDGGSALTKIGPGDFFRCRRQDQTGMVTTHASIAIFVENGRVTHYALNTEHVGP